MALLQGYSDQVGVTSDPESHCCILSEKLVCAAAGSGSRLGSLGGGGQVVDWPVGTVAQAVNESSMTAIEICNFTGLLLADLVRGKLQGLLAGAGLQVGLHGGSGVGDSLPVPLGLDLGPAGIQATFTDSPAGEDQGGGDQQGCDGAGHFDSPMQS